MIGRLSFFAVALAAGIALSSFLPALPSRLRALVGLPSGLAQQSLQSAVEHKPQTDGLDDQQSLVKLSADEVKAAGIETGVVEAGTLVRRIIVPGTIVPDADRIAHVAVKLSGVVTEMRKRIGDAVANQELLAILESRELADAKSEYLAARLTSELQKDLYERDKILWERRVTSEQLLLKSRSAAAQANMKLDIARQKLFALGLTETEIAGLPNEPEALLRRQEVRSPIAGRVVERKGERGMAVGRDNLETELFVVADLDRVWVDLAISPVDLPAIREGQTVSITAQGNTQRVEGKIIFIGPMLDKDSRSARAVVEIANDGGIWRPGSFVTAAIAFAEQPMALVVPTNAILNMGAATVAFVRTPEGFQKRQVTLGQSDDRIVEVASGLHAGEAVAVTNTFLLKAELLKALAEE
jgi:cobalt-zinc-cadmium efflux system membrane fusion protein